MELRRIVASVAHNHSHNNDDVNSVTSDDCAGCRTPEDVVRCPSPSPLPAAPSSTAPSLPAVSTVDEQLLAALDSELAIDRASSVSEEQLVCVSVDCSSQASTSSPVSCSDSLAASSSLHVVASTWSETQSNRPALSPTTPVSCISCSSDTSTTSAVSTVSSCSAGTTGGDVQQEVTAQEEPCHVRGCDSSELASCAESENSTGCCSKVPPPSDAASTKSSGLKETVDLAGSSCDLRVSDAVQLRSDAEPSSCPEPVQENNNDISVPVTSASDASVKKTSSTVNSTTSVMTSSATSCRSSSVQTSSSTGCSTLPDTERVFYRKPVSSGGVVTSATVSPRSVSSESSEASSKKDDLSVNCVKTSVVTAKSLVSASASSVTGSSDRASVATQTNPDLLGRYFHRRTKPISSFLGGSKHSRGSGGPKERLSSRMMSKSSTNSASSSSGSSAYHFGSTSSSSATSTSPVVTGSTVLLTSGPHVAPLIIPSVGPFSGINGKTTFLITVPANFTLPTSVATVIGPAGGGGAVPVSLGLSRASVTAISGSQLVARSGTDGVGSGRLSATVSSTAAGLVLGQSAVGSPLQFLVAVTTASSSSVELSLVSQSSLSRQQQQHQSGVVAVVTGSNILTALSSGVQASNSFRHDPATTTSVSSLLTSYVSSSIGNQDRVASTTPLQVALRASTITPSTVLMLPMSSVASSGSGRLLTVATSSTTVAVSSASLLTTTATFPRCSLSLAVRPTSSGARHATIASLPRVAMRRRSDVVVQSASSPSSSPVTLPNGLGHGRSPPAPLLAAPNTVRHNGGGRSPVGGTTPTVHMVAKQPVHGEGAPTSIIRAILERNLSCPLSYSVDEALTGHHITAPTPSPTDAYSGLQDGCYATSTAQRSTPTRSPVNQADSEQSNVTRDSASGQPVLVSQLTSTVADHVDQCAMMCPTTRSERQNAADKKRAASLTSNPAPAKHRRCTTDACTPAEQLSTRSSIADTDLTHITSRYSGSPSTVDSNVEGVNGFVGASGWQQTGSVVNDTSSLSSSSMSEPAQATDRSTPTTSPLTRVALPKKVYAYLGSAGAARENAAVGAAASVASIGDRPLQTVSTVQPSSVTQQTTAGTTVSRRTASDDGPIRHLRLMCSGLAASTAGLELRTHSSA